MFLVRQVLDMFVCERSEVGMEIDAIERIYFGSYSVLQFVSPVFNTER